MKKYIRNKKQIKFTTYFVSSFAQKRTKHFLKSMIYSLESGF